MTHVDWKALTQLRIDDAVAALAAGRWSWAYYNSGYIVECALKACIVTRLTREPDAIYSERRFGDWCWSHDFDTLARPAEVKALLDARLGTDPAFENAWRIIRAWKETSRYRPWPEHKARELFDAVVNPVPGVLTWLKTFW